jgi:hypothetical protein
VGGIVWGRGRVSSCVRRAHPVTNCPG